MRKLSKFLAILMLTSVAAPVYAAPAAPSSFDGPEFDQAVGRWIEAHPDVVLRAVDSYVKHEKEREASVAVGVAVKLTSELAEVGPWTPVLGSANGRIVLVEVLDANCVYCRRMEPALNKLIVANPDLKIVRRYVNFLAPSSEYAGRMASLVWKRHQGRYANFDQKLMDQSKPLSEDVIDGIISDVLGAEALSTLKSELTGGSKSDVDAFFAGQLDLVKRAQITGTPFFIVAGAGAEGAFRGAVDAATLQKAIDKARAAK